MVYVECASSHGSMHSTWYRCRHTGSSRTVSPVWNTPRHTTSSPVTLCFTDDGLYVNDSRPAAGLAHCDDRPFSSRTVLRRPRASCSTSSSQYPAAACPGGRAARDAAASLSRRLVRCPWQRLHMNARTSRKAPTAMLMPATTDC
jgi:hypothetical protein